MSIAAFRRLPLLTGLVVLGSLLSCGREVTGPNGGGPSAAIAFNPTFPSITLLGSGEVLGLGDVVPFERVRVVLRRANGEVAVERMVDFPAGQQSVTLTMNVQLGTGAPSTGEVLTATMQYINAAGDTVFSGGPVTVTARPASGGNPQVPVEVPSTYVGPGSDAGGISITPDSAVGVINQQVTFSAIVVTAGQTPIPNAPKAYSSTDSARVRVNVATGVATLLGARGTALIIVQSANDVADTALVRITPTPSALVLLSGGNQQTLQATPFANPIRVRVNAVDGLGVAGVTVNFAVTRGQGSVSVPSAVTDAAGEAQVGWIAGDSAGAAILTASVATPSLTLPVNGQQLSSAPSSLTFSASPANFTSGDTIPQFTVSVRDAVGGVVNGFSGTVTLALTGGTVGANLVGVTSRAAVNGVATFPGLTIDRAGPAYRVVASVTGAPSATTNTFTVAAAPPSVVTLLTGAGQTAPPSTALSDSIRVRVTDMFGFPVPGSTVQFAVVAGGGTVSPTTAPTNVDGRAATRWTLGASGAQQISVTVGAIQPVPVTATVFTGGGTPRLFVGTAATSNTVGGTRPVPVFLSPAAVSAVVAQLVMRDTLVAKWTADSIVFAPGATILNPTFTGRGTGSTYGVISSSAGNDSVLISVDSATIILGGEYNVRNVAIGDTLRMLIRLTAPAPIGGITVVAVSDDTTSIKVAPGSGRGAPSDPCDIYCYDLRADEGVNILATPRDSAFVLIPGGQLTGQLVVLPTGQSDGTIVTLTAPGYAGGTHEFGVEENFFYVYSYFGNATGPMPVGHQNRIDLTLDRPVARDVRVVLTSRNPSVVRVDSVLNIPRTNNYYYDNEFGYEALAPGQTWIVMQAAGIRTDSIRITVVNPYLVIPDYGLSIATGANYEMYMFASIDSTSTNPTYLFGPRATDLRFTASSTNPAVAQVELASGVIPAEEWDGRVTVRGMSPGTAWIRVSAPGHVPDSALVTVTAPTLFVSETLTRVGLGQLHESAYLALTGAFGGPLVTTSAVATVTAADTSIVSVLTPSLPFYANGSTPSVRLLGKAVGSTTLTFTVPGLQPVVQAFQVTVPDLVLGGTFAGALTLNTDSATYGLTVTLRDGVNTVRGAADTVTAIMRSTNPAVLLVTDSILRFTPGQSFASNGMVRTIAPGTARITVTAPNFTPDTSGIITLRPRALEFTAASQVHGRMLDVPITLWRRSPPTNVLPFTATVRGPAGSTVLAPADSFPIGATGGTVTVRAGALTGTDTLIVTAAAHAPDTILVVVGASRALVSVATSALVGTTDDFASVFLAAALGTSRAAGANLKFVLQSADTTIIQVTNDTIRVAAGNFSPTTGGYGGLRFLRPGAAWVRIVDPTGLFTTDSSLVYVESQGLYSNSDLLSLGMGQRTSLYEQYIYRPYSTNDSVWVRLTSSAPSIASAPDSVLLDRFSSYGYLQITAGDTVGGARITGTAPGYADLTMDVLVTRGALELYSTYNGSVTPGIVFSADAYLVDVAAGYTREAVTPVPLRVRSDDPSIMSIGADSLPTIATGEYAATINTLRGVAVGRTSLVFEDRRGEAVFQSVASSRVNAEVSPPRFLVNNGSLRIGVGAITQTFGNYLYAPQGGASVWVQLRSVGGRVAFDADSIFLDPQDSYYSYYRLRGVAVGVDTLVFSAPGYPPDSLIADVSPFMLERVNVSTNTIRQGDSTLVTLNFRQPDNGSVAQVAGSPLSLTFSTSGALAATQVGGTIPLTSLAVATGQTSVSFWLRATGLGGGQLTITGPSIRTFTMGVATR